MSPIIEGLTFSQSKEPLMKPGYVFFVFKIPEPWVSMLKSPTVPRQVLLAA